MSKNNSLALICSYEDEDDDDNEEEDDKIGENDDKHKIKPTLNRLPLPSSISELFKHKPDVNNPPAEDPALHGGRIRSFAHQRGNWATFVYVPFECSQDLACLLSRLAERATALGLPLKPIADLHISLTRTVVLLHHWIDGFVTSVRAKLGLLPRFRMSLGPPEVYCNEEGTRTFMGLRVLTGEDSLRAAVTMLDGCLQEFGLQPFYEDPSFHMSVLWVVGDRREDLQLILPQLKTELQDFGTAHPEWFDIDVTHCLCKTGNKMFTFQLSS